MLTYLVGHVLLNAVLAYPGPLLRGDALCAYLAVGDQSRALVEELFKEARYDGPFSTAASYFWRHKIDATIERLSAAPDVDACIDRDIQAYGEDDFGVGDFHRCVVEAALNRTRVDDGKSMDIQRHDCSRCDGRKGGYWCPMTRRAVCERDACSVAGSRWVPPGAELCRIERDFHDEWAPILGG